MSAGKRQHRRGARAFLGPAMEGAKERLDRVISDAIKQNATEQAEAAQRMQLAVPVGRRNGKASELRRITEEMRASGRRVVTIHQDCGRCCNTARGSI